MNHRRLDHVALLVEDLDVSVAYYRDVLGLAEIERPAFDFPGAWFRLGTDQELHLIVGSAEEAQVRSGANHFALLVDDIDEAQGTLEGRGAVVLQRQTRPDGAHQIYLEDPTGHTIEVCTAPHR
ncbi:MAG: VOC family protein [Acidobacteriota bacterium]